MGELFNVLVWRDAYETAESSGDVILSAAEIAAVHGLSIWDSVVLAAAVGAGNGGESFRIESASAAGGAACGRGFGDALVA
jgi:hypothetical protein